MSRTLSLLLLPSLAWPLAFALVALRAQALDGGDPVQSPACHDAVRALQAQEDALPAASAPRGTEALHAVRRRAAIACLGQTDARSAALPQHLAQPPLHVAPVTVPAPPPAVTFRSTPPAPPLPTAPIPPTVTACDAAGCWASDGSRLQRNGPGLVGPRGLCTVVGGVLRCP